MAQKVNIKIGGKAGEGIKTTGLILSKCFSRLGFSIFAYDEYPSLIRGGHNTYQMSASAQPVHAQHKEIDILIALDDQTVKEHQAELKDGGLILFNPEVVKIEAPARGQVVSIPWAKLAKVSGGSEIMANMVALGAVLTLCDLPLTSLLAIIADVFADKGEAVIAANHRAATAGADYVKKNFSKLNLKLTLPSPKEQIVVLGNEAIGAGAIAAGMKYFAAYPMTPTSTILHFLAEYAQKFNLVVNHVENEIAAVNSALGAASAGVRTMVATSGGGFSLMVEGLGMAGMAEVPLVVILGTRPGPASGMPTWTGQGDLRFALHAAQDEFPRVVLTPGDAFEAFELTKKAFVLAEKYQLPVIVLVDKLICESHKSGLPFSNLHQNQRFGFAAKKIPGSYRRYALTESGVSPRPFLGVPGGASLVANSYEHGEDSLVSEEAFERKQMHKKRLRKLQTVAEDLWPLPVFGNDEANTVLLGFGSTLGAALEAINDLPQVKYLHFNYVWPFPKKPVQQILGSAQRVVCLEGNALGQLQGLIREEMGIEITESLRKYDGRPFYPEEIVEYFKRS